MGVRVVIADKNDFDDLLFNGVAAFEGCGRCVAGCGFSTMGFRGLCDAGS